MAKRKKKPAKQIKRAAPAAKKPGMARCTVLGHSASSALRWMGSQGWTLEEATSAVAALGQGGQVAPATISTGLSDGRSGKWGKPADVTAAQAKELKAAAKIGRVYKS
jgi:hypothetical protein